MGSINYDTTRSRIKLQNAILNDPILKSINAAIFNSIKTNTNVTYTMSNGILTPVMPQEVLHLEEEKVNRIKYLIENFKNELES